MTKEELECMLEADYKGHIVEVEPIYDHEWKEIASEDS